MDGSNAPEWPKSRFADHCKRFFPHRCYRGVLGIAISPDKQAEKLCKIHIALNHTYSCLVSELIVFMHCVGILLMLPCPCVPRQFRKYCYTCGDMRLHTLISYVLLAQLIIYMSLLN